MRFALFFLFAFPGLVQSKNTESIYSARTVGEFLTTLSRQMDQKSMDFLRKELKGSEKTPLSISSPAKGQLHITAEKQTIQYEFVSADAQRNVVIKVNGKRIGFEYGDSFEKLFRRIMDSVSKPSRSAASHWRFLGPLEFAQAAADASAAVVAAVGASATVDMRDNQPSANGGGDCKPEILRELSEKFAIGLLCSNNETASGFKCIESMSAIGVVALIAYFLAENESRGGAREAAALANMRLVIRDHFTPEVRSLIAMMKNDKGKAKNIARLISELKKNPVIHEATVSQLSKALGYARAARLLKFGGGATIIGGLASLALTSPEECEKLNWPNIKPEDQKWIVFGMNCSRYVNSDFFTLSFEEQVQATARSPDLCRAIPTFKKDLEDWIASKMPGRSNEATDKGPPLEGVR